MSHARLASHDVQLASFDGERMVLQIIGAVMGDTLRQVFARLGRAFALLPGPQSVR